MAATRFAGRPPPTPSAMSFLVPRERAPSVRAANLRDERKVLKARFRGDAPTAFTRARVGARATPSSDGWAIDRRFRRKRNRTTSRGGSLSSWLAQRPPSIRLMSCSSPLGRAGRQTADWRSTRTWPTSPPTTRGICHTATSVSRTGSRRTPRSFTASGVAATTTVRVPMHHPTAAPSPAPRSTARPSSRARPHRHPTPAPVCATRAPRTPDRDCDPHEGYAIVKRWVERQFKGTQAAEMLRQYQQQAAAARASSCNQYGEAHDAAAAAEQQMPDGSVSPANASGMGAAADPTAATSASAGAFFSFTSNVDAHWLSAGFDACEVYEIHGNCGARGTTHAHAHALEWPT